MEPEKILKKLSENRQLLKVYGIKGISLFGSVVHEEARAGSDVDLATPDALHKGIKENILA